MNKCEKFDEWTECEKRGCKGCFNNKKRIIELNKIIDNEISNDIMKMFTKIFL